MSDAGSGKDPQGEIAEIRASRRRLAGAAHADRRAIERELHDGLQQDLAALAVDLQRLVRLTDDDAAAAKALAAEMTGIVHEALDEAGRLASRIYPQILDGRGLAGALRSAGSSAGITAVVDVPAFAGYPAEIIAALYWAWTDALSSAAAGSEATIKVLDADGGLAFAISVACREPDAHLGGLRDRLEALDGQVTISRRQDGGALVQGWLPLPR